MLAYSNAKLHAVQSSAERIASMRAGTAYYHRSAAFDLTVREREVVVLICDGLTTKDIARALAISPKTVETHRASMMRKLGTGSVAGVVRFAIRYGLVQA